MDGFTFNFETARHFSGRTLKRAQTLWSSIALITPTKKIYLGGDSGYGKHFKEIGEKHGPFDLVILECGQYNEHWKHIHMMPEELIPAASDLRSKNILPVHWAKFSLSIHAWDEPIERLTKVPDAENFQILTPMIGEKVYLDKKQEFTNWWKY